MYSGMEFSQIFVAGTNNQSYKFFYLFIKVSSFRTYIVFLRVAFFFSNPTGPFCTHVSTKCLKYVFCQNLFHKWSNM
jgi:hypothetical protein